MLNYSISIYFLLFMIYSILGWIMEITCQTIEKRKFVNRGFLIGPYCPIYGCGALVITIFLSRYTGEWLTLFLMSVVACGILEYSTSYIMEKLFHARWWDYSKKKYNINGRICLETLIPFGILGLAIMYITNPFIINNLQRLPENVLNIIAIIFATIFVIDLIISLKIISNVRVTSTKLINEFNKLKAKTEDNTEEITAKVTAKVKEILSGKSKLSKRLIDAYPDLKAKIKQKKEKLKEKTEAVKQEIKSKSKKMMDNKKN